MTCSLRARVGGGGQIRLRGARKAGSGEEPMDWLREVARESPASPSSFCQHTEKQHNIVLEGTRRIFLDTDGRIWKGLGGLREAASMGCASEQGRRCGVNPAGLCASKLASQPELPPPPRSRFACPVLETTRQPPPGATDGIFGHLATRNADGTASRRKRRLQSQVGSAGAAFDEKRCHRHCAWRGVRIRSVTLGETSCKLFSLIPPAASRRQRGRGDNPNARRSIAGHRGVLARLKLLGAYLQPQLVEPAPVWPSIGLRRGSQSPLIRRWVIEDCAAEARKAWN